MGGIRSGGHARSGPAPDPNSIRSANGQGGEWTLLPADGRPGAAPAWPLEPKATRRERALWVRYWRKPQAVMWERLGMADDLAQYVRVFVEAEQPGAPVSVRTLYRQLADALGLTLPGMRMMRWKIAERPLELAATGTDAAPARARRRTSARERFGVVPNPADEG